MNVEMDNLVINKLNFEQIVASSNTIIKQGHLEKCIELDKKLVKLYGEALEIDPNHKGALEYQGELFIQTNRIDLAYQNLNKLDELCPNSCFELEQLKESLLKYK